MTIFLQLLIGIFGAIGIALIWADIAKVPTLKVSKAANNLGKKGEKKVDVIAVYLKNISNKLARIIKLNEYKRSQLEADLQTAGLDISPESYVSDAIFKLLGLFIIFVAVVQYFSESNKVSKMIAKKKKKIENELPRFVSSIEKTMKHQKGVVYALEAFKDAASPEFREELEITIADMRSGNDLDALARLDGRVGSEKLMDITSGLRGAIAGDDMTIYWATTLQKLNEEQREELKSQASSVPRRVRKLSMALLFCFILIYVAVLGQVLLTSMGTLF